MANENPHRLEATIAGDAMAPVLARPDIGWYDLDVQRFLAWNCSIFFGIRCVIYPSLLIKTRMQAQRKLDRYTGVWNALCGILRREGVRGLYQGFVPFQAGSIFSQTLCMRASCFRCLTVLADICSFEYMRAQFPESAFLGNLIAGGLASVFSSVLQVPLEVVSQRQQIQDRTQGYVRTIDTMRQIARSEGVIRGFYRGWTVSLLLYAPYSANWWVVYGVTKDRLQAFFPLKKHEHYVHATCGVTAAAVSAVLTNCIEVVKTNLQVATSEAGQRPTIRSVMGRLWQEEGIRVLGKGCMARVLNVAPSSLLTILGYEMAKRLACKHAA